MLLTQSTLRVAMMSSKTARTSGLACAYSTSFTIAMAASPATGLKDAAQSSTRAAMDSPRRVPR